jgi:molybdopterin-guanine dinucleotide biosynthesis protein A
MRRTLIIMAGGKSSRMQQDKALLPFGGFESLSQYQYQRLLPYFDAIYISSKTNKFNFPVEVIEDCYKGSSPLVALISIFETLQNKELFLLSVDAPFVTHQTIEKIYQEAKNDTSSDIIVAESTQGIEPLCAIYRSSILETAKAFLYEENHRLQALLGAVKTRTIKIEGEREFMNLNYPMEYKEAKSLL